MRASEVGVCIGHWGEVRFKNAFLRRKKKSEGREKEVFSAKESLGMG